MIDLSAVVMSEAQPFTMVTRAPGLDIGNDWQEGAATSTTVQAVVWPATPEDALLVPEGAQLEATIGIITTFLMDTYNTAAGTSAARLVYGSKQYEVKKSEPWNIGGFYRSYATRVGQ